jgi:2-polyprenyl-3-methyl-5-hydroxy-6-metoxy-1,4-benzoquinol methylase
MAEYDAIADWYDETVESGGFLHALAVPALLDLAGDVAGLRVCDFACGQGIVSRVLAERGASVVGVDVSERLVDIARERSPGVEFRVADVQAPDALAGERFDGIVSNMALIAIADLSAALRTIRRCLRAGGWFVFSITHPCFQTPRSEWVPGGRAVYGYFEEGPWMKQDPRSIRSKVADHHRTLAGYVNELSVAGLRLERVVEPRGTGAPHDVIPALLVARVRG